MKAEIGSETTGSGRDGEVRAAVDTIDGRPHVVIADITRDGAWIAMADDEAADLSERR